MTRNPNLPTLDAATEHLAVAVVASSAAARHDLTARLAALPGLTVVDGAGAQVVLWDVGATGPTGPSAPPALALVRDASAAAPALAAGARGVLLVGSVDAGLAGALAAVRAGHAVIDGGLTSALIPSTASRTTEPTRRAGAPMEPGDLTERELQVVQLLAEGLSNKLIADRLQISDHTAKFHVGGVMTKLAAATRTEAVVEAMRRGLIAL